MKIIHFIKSKLLRNEAHYQFLVVFKDLAVEQGVVVVLPDALWASFDDLLAKERGLVDAARASELTKLIVKADARKDRTVTGMRDVVSSGLHHFNPTIVEAARVLSKRFKEFRRIAGRPYEESVAGISVLVSDLNGVYAPQVAVLDLQPWVDELEAANIAFQELFVSRNAEITARPNYNLAEIRKRIDVVYRDIVHFVDSALTVNRSAELEAFANLLNPQIDYFNAGIHRVAKNDLAEAVFDAVPNQLMIDGVPATPMPVVRFDGRKLAFATDYSVRYKNNRKPGTASIVVTGKGAYFGRREIAFNIVKGTENG